MNNDLNRHLTQEYAQISEKMPISSRHTNITPMRMAIKKVGDNYKCQPGCERIASLHHKQTRSTIKDAGKSATNTQTKTDK